MIHQARYLKNSTARKSNNKCNLNDLFVSILCAGALIKGIMTWSEAYYAWCMSQAWPYKLIFASVGSCWNVCSGKWDDSQ